jgi:2-polyprenyl-3-methyl-5-hydroxy-6-metoxy-1,4-benzoquinol methylase
LNTTIGADAQTDARGRRSLLALSRGRVATREAGRRDRRGTSASQSVHHPPEAEADLVGELAGRLPVLACAASVSASGPFPYDFEIDLEADSTHANIVRLVGEGKRVLELGPATGYMSRVLRDRGCAVTGIELDPRMAEAAYEHLDRLIVGDVEALDLAAELSGERFDVILAADVLEHLKDPLRVLRELRPFLDDGGYLAASVPNVAHGSVRLALLEGSFPYSERGLLDSTHLRFFTRESLGELMVSAGFVVCDVIRQPLDIDASEVPFDSNAVPSELRSALEADPDAITYQFIVRALPVDVPTIGAVGERVRALELEAVSLARERDEMQRLAEQRERELVSTVERMQDVERAMAGMAAREGDLRELIVDAQDQLIRRDEDLADALAQRGALEREVRELRVRLDRIHSLKPVALYRSLRHLPVLRTLEARRISGEEDAIRRSGG